MRRLLMDGFACLPVVMSFILSQDVRHAPDIPAAPINIDGPGASLKTSARHSQKMEQGFVYLNDHVVYIAGLVSIMTP